MVLSSRSEGEHIGTFWMLDLESPLPSSVVPRVTAAFQRPGPEAALQLAQSMELDDPAEIYHRFATGRRCYAAFVDGSLAAYGWISFGKEEIGELGMCIRLLSGEAYIWNCVTLPAYRGLRLYSALLGYMISELHAEGLRRIWIGADADNVASQIGMALAGFRPVADMVIACVVAMRRPWLRGRSGVPEHLVMDARRAIFGDAAQVWLPTVVELYS